ncbi:gephyrin, partial [Diaphorina citri]|uniref:molybdopterin adenylyltransferase n=1 Tax=Diaphorina citri TaxID=121845 RepID=A0A1S3DTT7_DIACI
MDQDLLELNKGVEVLLFDLNDNNDDYYILQSQSLIKTWCESNISSKLIGGHKLDVKIAIRDGKQIRGDIEKRIESEPDILFVFGGTELIHGHVTSEVCTGLIQKRITGIEFIIYSVVKSNPDVVLDQFVCGFCRKTLILTLPLVTKDTLSVLNQIQKVLKHALAVYHNDLPSVREKHGESLVVSTASAPPLKSKINRDVTQRSRKSLYPMLEVEAAQKLILDFIETNKCGQQKQSLSCRQAGGYIVAETTVAKDDLPPFDASIKDGYAVIASDGAGKRKVVGERSAGPVKSASPLKSSQCYRINTGAPIPPGADSVVQVEDTELTKGKDGEEVEIKILKTPTKGQDIRVKGIDIRKGATILEEGNLIGPPELGLLASVGVTSITVYKKPIIHILSTGNELDEPDAHVLKPGCIRDSNRTVLASLLSENGFSSVDKGICRDDPDLLLQCLKSNLASCDVIISTGSVSMGDKDYLKDILVTDLGASIHFGRVNMKPG